MNEPTVSKLVIDAETLTELFEFFAERNIAPRTAACYCGFLIGFNSTASDGADAKASERFFSNIVENFRMNILAGREAALGEPAGEG